jgi:KaiC/GvpD/RAD55 family RecA-like ATPase
MERVTSGINGLDDLVDGGLPLGRTLLLTGGPGTGKTTFGLQFLCEGAMNGEPGIALSLEEDPKMWREDMMNFGYDIAKLEASSKLAIVDASMIRLGLESDEKFTLSPQEFEINHILSKVIRTAKQIGAKRVLVDSLPTLSILYNNPEQARSDVLKMTYLLKANGYTSILITETQDGHADESSRLEEFVSDSVVQLRYSHAGADMGRSLTIKKMRGTKHSENIHPMEFVDGKGIVIKSMEDL